MKTAGDFINVLGKSIMAGMMIAIGGTVYLANDSKVVGAMLFTIGLFAILSYGMNLFTGKIGYLIENGWRYILDLGTILLGNLIGTYFVGILIRNTRLTGVVEKAVSVCDTKLSDDLLSVFILACFCGILMFLAVDGFKTIENPLGKYLAVFLGVMVFILSGFEHWCSEYVLFLGGCRMVCEKQYIYGHHGFGNAAGAIFFNFLKRSFLVIKPFKGGDTEAKEKSLSTMTGSARK